MDSRDIEDAANAWLHRKDVGPWDRDTEAAFERWLAESARHRVAYLRMESAWERSARLTALRRLDGAVPAVGNLFPAAPGETVEAVDSSARPRLREPPRSVPLRRWAAGVCVSLAVLATVLWWRQSPSSTYATAVGAIESIPIADGSTITLNTATTVRVLLNKDSRHIDLERGEALFEVAKDSRRPFVVQAGRRRIIAVGTKFSVRRDGEGIEITVTEGTVRIEGDRGTPATGPELAHAGTIARAADGEIVLTPVSLENAEQSMSWRRGILTFHDSTLADAAAELNRYNETQLRFDDEAVSHLPIAGEVRATNLEAFVRLVEQAYRLRAERVDGAIILHPQSP